VAPGVETHIVEPVPGWPALPELPTLKDPYGQLPLASGGTSTCLGVDVVLLVLVVAPVLLAPLVGGLTTELL
jgi:hypothetical protein